MIMVRVAGLGACHAEALREGWPARLRDFIKGSTFYIYLTALPPYRFRLINSASMSSVVVIIRELAWKPRC